MKDFIDFRKKVGRIFASYFNVLLFRVNPFWIQLLYFTILSLIGFLALKVSKPRKTSSFVPKDFDLFFTSVSAATVSSMSTVEMEVFSNTQLVLLAILMLLGGEVFTSMLGLHFMKSKLHDGKKIHSHSTNSGGGAATTTTTSSSSSSRQPNSSELGMVTTQCEDYKLPVTNLETMENHEGLKFNSIIILSRVVFCYLLVVHSAGYTLILIYLSLVSSAKQVLKKKHLNPKTFAVFTTVSTFANCGFVPTNENMIVFKKNSGLLLILIPQILMGNTLYPTCLRVTILFLKKFVKSEELSYMLKNSNELGYSHLLPRVHSVFLALTVFAFLAVQFVVFCSIEWHLEATSGLGFYEKMIGSLFQVVNSRHTGEYVFDLSALSPAILVLFVLMMYLPPYTSFLPIEGKISTSDEEKRRTKKRPNIVEQILFSQLSYLVIFVIIICLTERDKMKRDPLNFNALNIVIEVLSAYGNVGFSTGYSCAKQIHPVGHCKDVWYGFAGKWSDGGKFVLILVMFFGRLKKFHMGGGKAWELYM